MPLLSGLVWVLLPLPKAARKYYDGKMAAIAQLLSVCWLAPVLMASKEWKAMTDRQK
jgi:hypothetical protein